MTLRDLFRDLDRQSWNHMLYLPPGEVDLDTDCLVLDISDLDEEEDVPATAREAGYVEALSIQELRGIVANTLQQKPGASETEVVQAFAYYLENDAYETFR